MKSLLTVLLLGAMVLPAVAYTGQPASRGTNNGAYQTSDDLRSKFAVPKSGTPTPAPKTLRTQEVSIKIDNEGYYVNMSVNGGQPFTCQIDTGATITMLPARLVDGLVNSGSITKEEIFGKAHAHLADGKSVDIINVGLREVKLTSPDGKWLMVPHILAATTVPHRDSKGQIDDKVNAACLLGFNFFKALSSWKIDHLNQKLIVEWFE